MKALLISSEHVKQRLPFKNVADEYLIPAIEASIDLDLECLIGTNLVDKMRSFILPDGESSATGKYKVLQDDYITPYLVNKSICHAIPRVWAKISNEGVMQYSGDGANSVSHSDMDYQVKYYAGIADRYATKMQKYLCANANDIKEWRSTRDQSDTPASTKKTNCEIFLGI